MKWKAISNWCHESRCGRYRVVKVCGAGAPIYQGNFRDAGAVIWLPMRGTAAEAKADCEEHAK